MAIWSVAWDLSPIPAPHSVPWWVLAAGFAASELLVAHVDFEGQAHTVDLGAVPLLVGLVFCAPHDLLAARLVGLAAVLVIHRRQRPMKLAFNLANTTVELGAATLVFHAVLGSAAVVSWHGWVASYAATLTAFALSAIGITAVISLSLRRFERSASLLLVGGAIVVVTTALGILTVTIMWDDWLGLWLVVMAVGVAYAGLRAFVRLRNRYASLELLYRFTASVSGATDTDDVLRRTLERSRELMSAELAELVVSLPEGGWMTKRLDGDQIVTDVDRTADPARLESLVLHAGSPLLARRNHRDTLLRNRAGRARLARRRRVAVLPRRRFLGGAARRQPPRPGEHLRHRRHEGARDVRRPHRDRVACRRSRRPPSSGSGGEGVLLPTRLAAQVSPAPQPADRAGAADEQGHGDRPGVAGEFAR